MEACVSIIRDLPNKGDSFDCTLDGTAMTLSQLKACDGNVDSLRKIKFESTDFPVELTQTGEPTDLNEIMCGYLLPRNLLWPFFFSHKQENEGFHNLLYSRLSNTHPRIYPEAFKTINEGLGYVAIVGITVCTTYICIIML